MTPRVLIVDDEPAVGFTLSAILEEACGVRTVRAASGEDALEILQRGDQVDLVITDLKMPGMDGLTLLGHLSGFGAAPPTILITAHGSERIAVDAMKSGALDYFAKPFETSEVVRVVRRALKTAALASDNRSLRARLALRRTMVFESDAMGQVAAVVERIAGRDVTVLVTGESGTGKELVARAIVQSSGRADKAFVRFNCGALAPDLAEAELFGHVRGAFTGAGHKRNGLFREADGGTILLDEVNALDPRTQGALLRVLQEREVRPVGSDRTVPVDVRLLAATNRSLEQEQGFRKDLYYRLNVVNIAVPALRERPEDVAPLAHHFASLFGERYGLGQVRLSERLVAQLQTRSWPGNVRELQNTVERLVALSTGPLIDSDPLAAAGERARPGEAMSLKARVDAYERGVIADMLNQCGGNRSEAARRLSVSRMTLVSKIAKYGLP